MAARRHRKLLARSVVAAGTILAGIGIWTSVAGSAPISAPSLETDLIAPAPSITVIPDDNTPDASVPSPTQNSQPTITTPAHTATATPTPRVKTRGS